MIRSFLLTSVSVGARGITARPLRALLAGLSLFLGVVAIVAVQASAQVAQRAIVARSELSSGLPPTFAMELPTGALALQAAREVRASLTAMAAAPAAVAVTLVSDGSLGEDGRHLGVEVIALEGDLRRIRPFRIVAGGWFADSTPVGLAPHVVLNLPAADAVAGRPIGPRLRIGRSTERPAPAIIGVVDDGGDEPALYLPVAEALRWEPALAEHAVARLVVHEPSTGQAIRSAATAGLLARQVAAQPFQRVDQSVQLRSGIETVQRIFLIIAAVALLVGMVGILNIGLATVAESVDELALRRAMGMTRMQVAAIVITEALLVGALAAAAALGVSVAALEPLTGLLFPGLPAPAAAVFPYSAAIAGIAGSCAAAVLGALVPAVRAAGIPIARVMRA